MYQTLDDLDDQLKYKIKEHKRTLNNVTLVLLVWFMLIVLATFLSKSIPEIQDWVMFVGIVSIIPVFILELFILMKLFKIKEEKKQLELTRNSIDSEDY